MNINIKYEFMNIVIVIAMKKYKSNDHVEGILDWWFDDRDSDGSFAFWIELNFVPLQKEKEQDFKQIAKYVRTLFFLSSNLANDKKNICIKNTSWN